MEEIYVNIEPAKYVNQKSTTKQTGLRNSENRFHGAVVLFLGLLSVFLLMGFIGLGIHYYDSVQRSAAELSAVRANLTERLQAKVSSLTEQRDRLNTSLPEVNKELNYRTCPAGWTMFTCGSCYHLSVESGSWERGRQECRKQGADLVVIESPEEQMFLYGLTRGETQAWIGLTDRVKEGTWIWVDEAPLSQRYWRGEQPDNGGRDQKLLEEDCAHLGTGENGLKNWNDLPCTTSLRWICEKRP